MIMSPGVRRFALTIHIAASVGWLGAVGCFLALALAGLNSRDAQTVRAVYIASDLTTWSVIVPLGLASLVTGVVQALGTPWGLFRHYWVAAKLLLTALATGLLLLHTRPIRSMADAAARTELRADDLRGVRVQLAADAGAALLVLLGVTALSVYKPQGLTRYGWRKRREERLVLR
jgi:hypothetical protein